MAFDDAFDAALRVLADDDPVLTSAEVVGWSVLVEVRLPDGRRAMVRRVTPGQQSWTTQGYLSWAMHDEQLRQPMGGS